MKRPGTTSHLRGSGREVRPDSIAEEAYRELGGLEQWVMIRGRSTANPPLILLHGGPGLSETAFFRRFNAALEDRFTVVYWDQRGTGRSYSPTIQAASMTVEQFVADLNELIDLVRKRLGMSQVVIFGHSWGSALGALYASRFPEKVAVYVGCAQIGDWPAAESASYEYALAEARRRGSRRAMGKLREIGPPPYGADAVFTERTLSLRFSGGMRPRALWKMGRALVGGEGSSISELRAGWQAFHFTMDAMWGEVSRLNLVDSVPELVMPVYFLVGRKDPWIPPQTSLVYFDALRAPAKELIWFDDSGHEPFVDEPSKFNSTMIDLIRPALVPATTAPAS